MEKCLLVSTFTSQCWSTVGVELLRILKKHIDLPALMCGEEGEGKWSYHTWKNLDQTNYLSDVKTLKTP